MRRARRRRTKASLRRTATVPGRHGGLGGVTAAACVALIVAAFVIGTAVRSPSEQAVANAQSQPLVTAKVEQRTVGPLPFGLTILEDTMP